MNAPPRNRRTFAWTVGILLGLGLLVGLGAATGSGSGWFPVAQGWGMMGSSGGGMGGHHQGSDHAMDQCPQDASMEDCHALMHNETMDEHHNRTHDGDTSGMGRR